MSFDRLCGYVTTTNTLHVPFATTTTTSPYYHFSQPTIRFSTATTGASTNAPSKHCFTFLSLCCCCCSSYRTCPNCSTCPAIRNDHHLCRALLVEESLVAFPCSCWPVFAQLQSRTLQLCGAVLHNSMQNKQPFLIHGSIYNKSVMTDDQCILLSELQQSMKKGGCKRTQTCCKR